jgi:hypothetical protein
MIDPWLTRLRAGITGRDDTDQVPATCLLQHQRAAAVALQVKWLVYVEEDDTRKRDGDSSMFKQYAPTMTKAFVT